MELSEVTESSLVAIVMFSGTMLPMAVWKLIRLVNRSHPTVSNQLASDSERE